MPTLVVGAGICGLTIASHIPNCVVWEKSRGVGGRLATRRTDTHRFDHGAQYYTLQIDITTIHDKWVAGQVSRPWFADKWCGVAGMTSLAKDLATTIDIRLETRLTRLVQNDDSWLAETTDGKREPFDCVILTCPLPQAMEIADHSQLAYEPSLRQVQYAQALVGLFEVKNQSTFPSGHSGYLEPQSRTIFSLSDQQRKGISQQPAWTVVMRPEFSAMNFDHNDDSTLDEIEAALKEIDPAFIAQNRQLKKWRYSHPLQTAASMFHIVQQQPKLLFAGDAFGGASIVGAVRSATSVIKYLKSQV
jgi:renalase